MNKVNVFKCTDRLADERSEGRYRREVRDYGHI